MSQSIVNLTLPAWVQVRAFPLVNDEHVRGLMARYNGALLRLRQAAGQPGKGGRGGLEKRLAQAEQEKSQLMEENEHLKFKIGDARDRCVPPAPSTD